MSQMTRFTLACIAALVAAWLLSGERFLDAVFNMMDLGSVDDTIIAGVVVLEDWKAGLSLPDVFGSIRMAIHRGLGLL
ncbi:hypothetical protein [Psychromarinibacter halotolerans]|uniref:DUF1232 domain-containing protein n=1 Tax=Psychromarinibacter halotolerans TaxID=1775175 RepID=A0ABV7GP11_9RHOB|nr:hypothetical protein [Psychromarinibacter halotolerans]MDF0595529.1 hypothetical protein [Psychromarinibacter halotolerans]